MTIPKWLHNKRIAILDIETDRIPTTLIHMIGVGILSIDDNGTFSYEPSKAFTRIYTPYSHGSLLESIALVQTCDYWCGHNLQAFDEREIRRHLSVDITIPALDTLIISKIMLSKDELYAIDAQLKLPTDIWGSYSLKAFGMRLGGAGKIEFEDFDNMSEDMAIYMNQDVDLTARLLKHLMTQENFPLQQVIDIEHKAATIIAEQTEFGFYIDIDKARELNTALLKEKGEIARELATVFKPKWLKDGPVKTYKKPSVVRKYLPDNNYIPLLGTKL